MKVKHCIIDSIEFSRLLDKVPELTKTNQSIDGYPSRSTIFHWAETKGKRYARAHQRNFEAVKKFAEKFVDLSSFKLEYLGDDIDSLLRLDQREFIRWSKSQANLRGVMHLEAWSIEGEILITESKLSASIEDRTISLFLGSENVGQVVLEDAIPQKTKVSGEIIAGWLRLDQHFVFCGTLKDGKATCTSVTPKGEVHLVFLALA